MTMPEYGYRYNIILAEDAPDVLGTMKDFNLSGWEAISVFTGKDGMLNVVVRKPMTQEEHEQAMLLKYGKEKVNK